MASGATDATAQPAENGARQSSSSKGLIGHALEELGLVSVYHSARDVKLLFAQRLLRLVAYGSSTLVLVAYLEALAITKSQIGLFMTLTLAGDVCISFVLTMFADGVGRKATLALGALLMAASGVVFALFRNYWLLLAAAVFGVITPSGNEIGPFRAIEDSIVAHLTTPATRGDIYSWFTLVGKAGTAIGMILCGWAIHVMTNNLHWDLMDAYRAVFISYATVGVLKFALAMALSSRVESDKKVTSWGSKTKNPDSDSVPSNETTPLLAGGGAANGASPAPAREDPKPSGIRSLLPNISKESRLVIFNMCLLFSLNAFCSGLAPMSWVTYFFRSKFNIEEGSLGTIFFAANLCSATSILVASSLAKRFGNVNIMVFTHLPSSIFTALLGVPNDIVWALTLLFLRDSTKSMNVGPRSAFMAAMVQPHERTALIGLVNVVKTLAQTVGPAVTGVLAEKELFWVAFMCSGAGKIVYDIGMLIVFKRHEMEAAERARARLEGQDRDEEATA